MHADITMEMTILEALAGGFIGKGGSNISRIRNASGATIKVSSLTCTISTRATLTISVCNSYLHS